MQTSPNVSLALLLAMAASMPHTLGPKRCGKEGVGAWIKALRAELPGNGVGPYVAARREAVQLLESHCRLCGRCKVARRLLESA